MCALRFMLRTGAISPAARRVAVVHRHIKTQPNPRPKSPLHERFRERSRHAMPWPRARSPLPATRVRTAACKFVRRDKDQGSFDLLRNSLHSIRIVTTIRLNSKAGRWPVSHMRTPGAEIVSECTVIQEQQVSARVRFLPSAGRRSAHFRMASNVGQRDWPHGVKQYSTSAAPEGRPYAQRFRPLPSCGACCPAFSE